MKRVRSILLLGMSVIIACASSCNCSGPDKIPHINMEKRYERDDLLRFLRAAPDLYGELMRYGKLTGVKSIETLSQLDAAAAGYGYSNYSEFAVAYTRFTNAVTYIRMLEKNSGDATIAAGGGFQDTLMRDAEIVRPHLDDVERIVAEAKRRR